MSAARMSPSSSTRGHRAWRSWFAPVVGGVFAVVLASASVDAQTKNPDDFIEEIGGDDAPSNPVSSSKTPKSGDAKDLRTKDAGVVDAKPTGTSPTTPPKNGADPARGRDGNTTGQAVKVGGAPSTTGTPAKPASDAAKTDSVVEIRALHYDGVAERFAAYTQTTRGGDAAAENRAAAILETGMLEFGLDGQSGRVEARAIAVALLIEARDLAAKGDVDKSRGRIALAKTVAPTFAAVFVTESMLAFERGDIGLGLRGLIAAVSALVASPITRPSLVALMFGILVLTTMVAGFLFAGIVVARSFRFFAFDVHNALPRGVARWQISFVVGVLMLLPWAAGVGVLFVLLIWLLVAIVYLAPREQGVAFVLAFMMVLSPLAVTGAARSLAHASSTLARDVSAISDVTAERERSEIGTQIESERSLLGVAALAEDALREGRMEEALSHSRLLVQRAPDEWWAHNNMGVVAGAGGNHALAEAAFKDAALRNPVAIEPMFNLHLVQLRSGKAKPGDASIDAMVAQAPARIELLRRATYRAPDEKISQNRAFVLAAVPSDVVGPALRSPSDTSTRLAAEITRPFSILTAPAQATTAAFLMFVILIVLGRASPKLMASTACTRCGAPSGRRYDAPEVPVGTCSACFHAFVRADSTLDAGMRMIKERQIVEHRRRTRALTRLLGLTIPGGGHLYAGAPVRAFFAMGFVISLSAVTAALYFGGALLPYPSVTPLVSGIVFAPLALAVVVHLGFAWDAVRVSE